MPVALERRNWWKAITMIHIYIYLTGACERIRQISFGRIAAAAVSVSDPASNPSCCIVCACMMGREVDKRNRLALLIIPVVQMNTAVCFVLYIPAVSRNENVGATLLHAAALYWRSEIYSKQEKLGNAPKEMVLGAPLCRCVRWVVVATLLWPVCRRWGIRTGATHVRGGNWEGRKEGRCVVERSVRE